MKILCTLIFAAVVGWWASGPASDEVTVYTATCVNNIIIRPFAHYSRDERWDKDFAKQFFQDRQNCVILLLNDLTYKVNLHQSEVYYQSKLDSGPKRLVKCAIMDSSNWRCEFPDGSGYIAVINGLKAIKNDSSRSDLFSLYRWQYWYVTWYWFIMGKGPQGAWLIPKQESL